MEVERPVREVQQRRRDELAIVGQDGELRFELQHRGDRLGRAQPCRGEDGRDAKCSTSHVDVGRRLQLAPSGQPRWRGDHADEVDVAMLGQAPQGRDPERAAPEEDGPHARAAGSPVDHARALVASRTSASSSFEAPTAISSSIDSR